MAKKILGALGVLAAPFTGGASLALTAGSTLIGGKKPAAATSAPAAATTSGPIIKKLATSPQSTTPTVSRPFADRLTGKSTILRDTLGN